MLWNTKSLNFSIEIETNVLGQISNSSGFVFKTKINPNVYTY